MSVHVKTVDVSHAVQVRPEDRLLSLGASERLLSLPLSTPAVCARLCGCGPLKLRPSISGSQRFTHQATLVSELFERSSYYVALASDPWPSSLNLRRALVRGHRHHHANKHHFQSYSSVC